MYLHDTEPKWGILSNGALWRLYCKERRRDEYFEVNLPSIIISNDLEAFKFFYYFFRKEAFIPTRYGDPFLDRVIKGSAEYAQEIGEDLKKNVYRAMQRVAEGFIDWKQNQLNPLDPAALHLVQKNTMILLYRFLFLLYAEGKGLLDLDNPTYRETYSFSRLKKEVKEKTEGPIPLRYLPSTRSLYTSLRDLFQLIDEGSVSIGIPKDLFHIPAYNGGLFDPQKHPELEEWRIGDSYLAEAIDLLSRSKPNGGSRDFVDYSTLEIRHLGSIYEGLLEYRLQLAESDLVASDECWVTLEEYNKGKKKEKGFTEFDENDRVSTGHLYLVTDKGERKSSGSYYTPDYIVNHIVKNTIDPIVEERWHEALEKYGGYIAATLSIKVLDPAMGSGHFLVGAVDYLAQKLLEAVQKDLHNGAISNTSAYTTEWARREIVSHCIYGVDLNELAVELAKVGLWLTTISKDKPLSFLDHRLKQGNSLIGAKITDLAWYHEGNPQNAPNTSQRQIIPPVIVERILTKINTIEQTGDDNLDDIKTKERLFLELQNLPEYQKVMQIADLNTSFYFGNRIEKTEYRIPASYYYDLVASLHGNDAEWKNRTRYQWFKKAITMGKEKSFFHWELEFPEIFFDAGKLRENAGWDAVLGNPPWGKISAQAPEKQYLNVQFQSIREGEINFYNLFIAQCYCLAKKGGIIGQIVPSTWLINKNSCLLRKFILLHYRITSLHYLCKGVFKDAPDTIPVIFEFVKEKQSIEQLLNGIISVRVVNDELLGHPQFLTDSLWEDSANQKTWFDRPLHQMSVHDTARNYNFCRCLETNSIHLGTIGHASDGIYKSTVEKFKKTSAPLSTDMPVIESAAQLSRYEIKWGGSYIPEELWSKHQPLHVGIKIVLHAARKPKLKRRLVAASTADNIFFSNRFILIKMLETAYSASFICSLLNSKVMNHYFKIRFPITDIDGYMLHQLPIPSIHFTTQNPRREALIAELMELYNTYLQNFDPSALLSSVHTRHIAQPEEVDVIHDLLAFLAEQIAILNKAKNAEIVAFLKYIESEIGVPVDTLSNKTVIQGYHSIDSKNNFKTFFAVIEKNKRKLRDDYNLKSRANRESLEFEYNSSIAKLKPMLAKIDATDQLIDQIVYKLYGLTQEEIGVIEGRSVTE